MNPVKDNNTFAFGKIYASLYGDAGIPLQISGQTDARGILSLTG